MRFKRSSHLLLGSQKEVKDTASNLLLNKDQVILEEAGMPNGTTLVWRLFTSRKLKLWALKFQEKD
ncbi:hypothetical protein A2U01_0087204 [Trifolium medium]|uniref:Uncharacterized protein n=1 Tax=Trifolium medium TaxID=97028 RepID=A0A392U0N0_9FABA|nr:hypothetical protein [Trifolium medium]